MKEGTNKKEGFSIRPMAREDLEEVLEMMKVFYASPAILHKAPEEVLRRDIEDCVGDMPYVEGYIFMEAQERIAGYAIVAKGYSTEYGGLCLWAEDIYIKPEYRHRGLVSLFFACLEEKYRGRAVRYRLEVEEKNRSAVEAYKKNGYHVLPYMEMTKEV